MLQPVIQKLAKQLNLTDHEPEPYILTKEEEEVVIRNAIEEKKKYVKWKLESLNLSPGDILTRMSRMKFEKMISRDELLKAANSRKSQDLWHRSQREKEKEIEAKNRKDLAQLWDAKQMWRLMKWTSQNVYGKQLIVNDFNKRLITALCYFLSEDKRFETELGYDLNKGLLIRGVAGVGKTFLLKCLENNELNPIIILSMLEITDEIRLNGEYNIEMGSKKVLYLDDVGTETATVKHFGTQLSFFKNFIEIIYLKNNQFNKLIVSTNKSFAEWENDYGFRVRSRSKDMFNVIDVNGFDMRGKNK